ncbi:MAG: ABC transporter substrate-binding protein [Actinomycetota bacterium]|nr:ABC transporter substrate-binding protein [Actinomycetota bacterium]MDQ2956303.1 ABC transporter substrate-binding protein [Actinomycetota bacterium]
MPTKRLLAATAVAVAALSLSACANKATTGSTGSTVKAAAGSPSVTIMVGGLSKQIYLPYMLAQSLGYYAKAGINVKLENEPAGGDATQNMLAGQVDGVGGFYDHNIALQGQGKSSESVISMLQIPGEVEMCRTDLKGKINSPADWKGLSLGITDTGSSTDFLTQYLATKNGVDPATTHRRGVGAGTTFIAAMKQKAISCGMTTEPTVSQILATKIGFILLDMRTASGSRQALGGTYPATSLYMTTAYVDGHKDVVQKLVNAYVSTLKWIQGHTGADIADQMPPDYYAGVGKDAYAKALDSEKGIFNPSGIMPPDGPSTCLAVLAAFNPNVKGKSIDLTKTYTDEFVKAAQPVS